MPWGLILAQLGAHRVRSLLTVGSVAVAVFLLCVLRTVVTSLEAGVAGSASDRLVVQSAVSLFVDLPLSYQSRIEAVPGVARTLKLQWFGGYYREPSNFFAQFGVDHDRFLDCYPEVELVEGSEAEFRSRKTACIIGQALAERYGWRIGDRIPLVGTIFPRLDGRSWEFEVVAIYRARSSNLDQSSLWFRFDHLLEAIEAGDAGGPRGVGVFLVGLAPGADPVAVMGAIDALFEHGPQRVQTTTEAEFQRQFVGMIGGVKVFLGAIGGAILFALLLAAGNTMLMSARQRTREFGILKALGFRDGQVLAILLAESLGISLLGGLLGLSLAVLAHPPMGRAMAALFPTFDLATSTIGSALGLSVLVGFLAGILPSLRAARLEAAAAIRTEL